MVPGLQQLKVPQAYQDEAEIRSREVLLKLGRKNPKSRHAIPNLLSAEYAAHHLMLNLLNKFPQEMWVMIRAREL